jgi:hypothetical protein
MPGSTDQSWRLTIERTARLKLPQPFVVVGASGHTRVWPLAYSATNAAGRQSSQQSHLHYRPHGSYLHALGKA